MKNHCHHRLPVRSIRNYCRAREQGFTLIELIVVVVIAAILLGAGVPSFRNMIISMRIKNASFDVHSSIVAARSEAITRNTTITITPSSGTTNWASGWSATTAGGVTVKTQDAFRGITVDGPSTLVYNSSGRLATAANCPSSGTATWVCIHLTDAAAINSDRCVIVDLSGRPSTTKGVCP
jgi:type IV fimbrial biogenesis protein FimT